jgi:2,3-bisphosphoglycerate-dependent phosphoglycerate mutase
VTSALVLLRHGESAWNATDRFAGRADVQLSPRGEAQAREAGARLLGFSFDAVLVSPLARAVRTAELVLAASGSNEHLRAADGYRLTHVPALVERDLGTLTGRNKTEVAREVGADTLAQWRYVRAARPPDGETLADVIERLTVVWESDVRPRLREGQSVLVAAHNHSLRALRVAIGEVPDGDVVALEVPNAVPRVYGFANDRLGPGSDR